MTVEVAEETVEPAWEPPLGLEPVVTPLVAPGMADQPERSSYERSVVGRNIAALLVAQVVTWGLAMAMNIAMPRYLGPEGMGQLSLGASVWAIALVVAEFGTSTLLTLDYARDSRSAHALLRPVVALRCGVAAIAALAVLCLVIVAGYPFATQRIVLIVGIGAVLTMISEIARASLYGLQAMPATAGTDILVKAAWVSVVLPLLIAGLGTTAVAFAAAVPAALLNLLLWRALRARSVAVAGERRPGVRSVARRSSPYLVGSAVMVTYGAIDVITISLLATPDEIGWYAVAALLLGTLVFIPSTMMTSLFPVVAKAHHDRPEAVPGLLYRTVHSSWLVAIPLGLGTVVMATPVCTLLFGESFAEAGPVLAVGGIVLILMFQTIPLGRFAFAVDRKKLFNTVMFTATALTVPLDLVLVPWTHEHFGNGGIGAAVSFVFTESLILIVLVVRLAPQLLNRAMFVRIGKCAIAGGALFVAAWFVRDRFLLLPIALGAVAYGVAIVVLRVPDRREREIARKLWSLGRARLPFAHPPSTISNEAKP